MRRHCLGSYDSYPALMAQERVSVPASMMQDKRDKGPLLCIHYRDPDDDWEGFLVIDRLINGSAVGGCRMTTTVTMKEVMRLARGMTQERDARHRLWRCQERNTLRSQVTET